MNVKNILLAFFGLIGAHYIGYTLWESLILFNLLLIVGILSEAFFSKSKDLIDLDTPLWESELALKEGIWVNRDKPDSGLIFYHVKHYPQGYNLSNILDLARFKFQVIDIGNSTFLRFSIKVPSHCNDLGLFFREKNCELLGTLKQLIPGLVILPITYRQLIRIQGFV